MPVLPRAAGAPLVDVGLSYNVSHSTISRLIIATALSEAVASI